MKFINEKKIAKAALDKNFKTFVVNIVFLKALLFEMIVYSLQKSQIATLKQNEVFTNVSIKYSNFVDVFLKKKLWCY